MMIKTIRIAAVALAAAVAFTSAPAVVLAQSVTDAPAASENLTRLQSRVDELEGLLREATADNERLAMELRRARNENARLQQSAEAAPPAPVVEPAPPISPAPTPSPAARAVTPPPSAAGQLGTLPAQSAPGDAAQAFREARRLLDATRWPEAEVALTSFLRTHPESPDAPEARYFLGRTQIVVGHYSDAAATFVEFLRKSPTSPRAADAWVRLGVSLKGMGQTAQACATFRDLPAKYPNASAAVRATAQNEARAAQCPAR